MTRISRVRSSGCIALVLPLPKSPNRLTKSHPMASHREKRAYQTETWVKACQQQKPPRDPPERVTVDALFCVKRRRDEDNLMASLKYVLDTLRQKQTGSTAWRLGIADLCGYLIDDDPEHCTVNPPAQVLVKSDPRVEVTITW